MSKSEIASLALIVIAVVVLIFSFQTNNDSLGEWMMMLFFALIIWAMDPTFSLKRKQKTEVIEQPIETEEDETGFIDLASAVPLDKNTIDYSETYLQFYDIESENYYYIHYIDSKADEIYLSGCCFIDRQNRDDLYESYLTLDGLLETDENEEINDLYTISAEDFALVRTKYQDQIVNFCKSGCPTPAPQEPVNRVGKGLAYILLAIIFVVICTAISILPCIVEHDGGNYIAILILFCFVFLSAILFSLSPRVWLERRIKWLIPNIVNIQIEKNEDKHKCYYTVDTESHTEFEYYPKEKLMIITKWIQIPLINAKQEYERLKNNFIDWFADKSFIENYGIRNMNSLGEYGYKLVIPKAKANKATMKKLREWIFLPEHDSSKVCQYFMLEDKEGTFYVKYQNCHINKITYIHNNGTTETFDPEKNSLHDNSLSAEIRRFYVDFEYYIPRMKPIQREI